MDLISRSQFLVIYVCINAADASVRLEPSKRTVNNGVDYRFTLRVSQPDVKTCGVLSCRRTDPPAVLCIWDISSGKLVSDAVRGYDCGTGREANSYYLNIAQVSKNDSGNWYCQYGTAQSNEVSLDVKYVTLALDAPKRPVRRGDNVTFSLRVGQPENLSGGLLLFRGGYPDHEATLCSLSVTTGSKFTTAIAGYDCWKGQETGSYYLHLTGVSSNDSDTWFCQYGTVKSNTVSLDLKSPPTVEIQPEALLKFFTYSVGDTNVSLNCKVSSANPKPSKFRWYHGNTTVGESQIFIIPTVNRSNEGLYRCEADNGEAPYGEDTVTLNVHSEPEQPGRLQVYDMKTQSLSLSWEKGYNGGAVQTFSIEYKRDGEQWIKYPIILSDQGDLELELDGLEPSTDYGIRLRAHNEYGYSDYAYVYAKTWPPPMISHKQLDVYTGVGMGIAAMMGVVVFCLLLVLIFRTKVALCMQGSRAVQRTTSVEMVAANHVGPVQNEAEEDGYEMPGNKYEDLGVRTVEPPKTYEQLKTYQNM